MPPVQWQLADIPLATGINTRDDSKLLPPVRLLDLQNAVLTKGGALLKRNGSLDLGRKTLSAGTVATARALATRGNELVLVDGEGLLAHSSAVDAWAERGDLQLYSTAVDTVANSTDPQTSPDCASADGITVFAWFVNDTATGKLYYSVYDTDTRAVIQGPTLLSTNANMPRVVAVENTVLVLYRDGASSDIRVKRIVAADLAASIAAPTKAFGYSDIHVASDLDAVTVGNVVVWACRTTANACRVGIVTQAGTLGGPGMNLPAAVDVDAANVTFSVVGLDAKDGQGTLIYKSSTGLRQKTFVTSGVSLTTPAAGTLVTATAAVAVAVRAESSGTAHVWWEVENITYPSRHYVQYALVNNTGTLANQVTIRHAGLGSTAFELDGQPRVHLHHNSVLQGTYFMVGPDGKPIGRVLPGTGYGRFLAAHLPRVSSSAAGQYEWAATFKSRLSSDQSDAVYTQPGIAHVRYDLTEAVSTVDRQGTLYLSGGQLWQYDGESPVEAGFLLYPEDIIATPGTGGSLTPSGSVFYTCYWEWFNARGEREQSTASQVLEVVLGSTQNQVTLTIPTLSATHKQGARRNVSLALYRSQKNGTTRYRVSSLNPLEAAHPANNYVINSLTADTVTFVDRLSDTDLDDRELDYQNQDVTTTFSELPNVQPPALFALAQAQGRTWGVSAENRRRAYYSKLARAETALEWTDVNYIDLPSELTGISVVSGQPVFFAKDAIYYVNGDGPDNLGQGVYGRVEQVPNNVGLVSPRTLVRCPVGLVFQSLKGFWLLGNNLQVNYVGADVTSWSGQTFTGAESLPDVNQVRFLCADPAGRSLVFDYERNLWYTFTRFAGVASTVWQGTYCYVDSTGLVRRETPGAFRDSGNGIALSATTAWFKPADSLQGFGRVKRVMLLGRYRSVHKLRIEVGYDYEDTWRETFEVTPSSFIESATWGSADTWGADAVWGGSGDSSVYQTKRDLPRQKCQAMRFRITEVPGEDAGEGLELNLLTLLVGRKDGTNRLPQNRTI